VEHVNSNSPDTGIHDRLQALCGGSAHLRSAFSAVATPTSADLEGDVARRSFCSSLKFKYVWSIIQHDEYDQ
jgi:hypothetical protein